MKKYFYILAALSIAPNFALAQGLDSEVDTELDQVAAPQASAQSSSQPIYILNQATPTANSSSGAVATQNQVAVQKQPTMVVEATPLSESRAEAIRKARQDAELHTEQKIVEKLEVSRMEDEKKRADVLFGDKFQQMQNGQGQTVQQVQVQAVQPVAVQPVAVAPVQVQEVKPDNTRDIVREEIRAAMKADEESVDTPIESRYFGAIVGIGDYPEVRNVKGNYSLGASFGTKYDNFIVEGSFLYSNYRVETGATPYSSYGYGYGSYAYSGYGYIPAAVDVNQYSGALAAKYEFFGGFIRPNVGGVIQYSYRTFAWANDSYYGYNPNYGNNGTSASSHAIDVGVVGGADLAFTPKFALGLDFRYMFNMASRVDTNNSYWMTSSQYGTPIEKLQYYVMSITGKVTF